jgi:hypothetical protein
MGDTLQHTHLDGTADYISALDTLCGLVQRGLYVFENDFDNLGFNSEARYNKLRALLLASPSNQLHLLAHNVRPLSQRCPRLMMLLRQFGHNMHIYQTPKHLAHLTEPFAVADTAHYVRRFHFDDPRGILAEHDPAGAGLLKSRFAEMWAASHPAVSPTTLGL